MMGLVSGNGEAMGGLEAFGGSVGVSDNDIFFVIVILVGTCNAGDRSFTRGRC